MLFKKRLSELTADEVWQAIQGRQETYELEFKGDLPAKDRSEDRWYKNQSNGIGDHARNKILAEVIAFANAHGGVLVLGAEESNDSPRVAIALKDIPYCADLADRLRKQLKTCVQPEIALVEIEGIRTNGHAGIVVIRIPKSRRAPHRLIGTKECYVRRADRCEEMDMREIQDLTLQRASEFNEIEKVFASRGPALLNAFGEFTRSTDPCFGFGIRATLLPIDPIYIDRVFENAEVNPPVHRLAVRLPTGNQQTWLPDREDESRPLVRGWRLQRDNPSVRLRREVYNNGQIEYLLLMKDSCRPEDSLPLRAGWFMGVVANALCAAERIRVAAGAPGVEYGLELVLLVHGRSVQLRDYDPAIPMGILGPGSYPFPRCSVHSPDEFPRLVRIFDQDLWDLFGQRVARPNIDLDFSAAIPALDAEAASGQ